LREKVNNSLLVNIKGLLLSTTCIPSKNLFWWNTRPLRGWQTNSFTAQNHWRQDIEAYRGFCWDLCEWGGW